MIQREKLTLSRLIGDLMAAGRLSEQDAELLKVSNRQQSKSGQHPIEVIAAASLSDQLQPSQILTLDRLSEWAGKAAGRSYFRIDP